MKKIFDKKTIITVIICGIIFTSIGVYATNYFAKDVTYKSNDENWKVTNVNDALDDLYVLANDDTAEIIETGTVSQYLDLSAGVNLKLSLKNTYTEEDNAKLILLSTSVSGLAAPYLNAGNMASKIVGNSKSLYLTNAAGLSGTGGTTTINYAVVKLKEN